MARARGAARDVGDRPLASSVDEPILRWGASATSVAAIQRELGRLWAGRDLSTEVDGVRQRHVAARTSVMNLVVVASRIETAERAASTIAHLAGRHPSRTLLVVPIDPDGPAALRGSVEARCTLPRAGEPETCSELVHLEVGGAAGRHLESIVAPLLVHDLPVTVWWPDEPRFGTPGVDAIVALADRLVVDGSRWSGDGLARLRAMAVVGASTGVGVSDFALVRQSRWREALASVFDRPDLLPYLGHVRRIAVTYATHDPGEPAGATNVVKPVYHVAWLASRLGLAVERPLAPRPARGRGPAWTLDARLRGPGGPVEVAIGPAASALPPGTTLEVELLAERRGSELRAAVTADAEAITVRGRLDGVPVVDRSFLGGRRTDVDLLSEAIELGTRDRIAAATIRFAAALVADGLAPGTGDARPDDDREAA